MKIYKRNLESTISAKIIKGEQLRIWEIGNLKEDFRLFAEKKQALVILGKKAMEDAKNDSKRENSSNRRTELKKQKKLIETKYDKVKNEKKMKYYH